ncbi:hypothetical protein LJC55_04425, partial [Eubacteriales bacterium OttesenSCG-928-N14]|nr:hypothetical protein [Eubacteriales bacterium OttesenSCG-928-N14]
MANYAAIDIGTNSVRLLIASDAGGNLCGSKQLTMTRIGEGTAKHGRLGDAAMARTYAAISHYVQIAKQAGCILPVYCYATSAVREAENGADFMRQLQGIPDLVAEVISGQEEGRLGYLGAACGGDAVVMDIGGGSTELILGESGKITRIHSELMGVVTALEQYIHHDPPQPYELAAMQAYTSAHARHLVDTVLQGQHITQMTCIGGTGTQIAMLVGSIPRFDAKAVHGYTVTRQQLRALLTQISQLSDAQRKALPGMDAQRSDVILSGSCIALSVLEQANCDTLCASITDGLDAYLSEKIANNAPALDR